MPCYYPPTPFYHPDELLTVIGDDIDRVVQANPDAVIIVTGDLKTLNYNALESDYGLQRWFRSLHMAKTF